jgi:plastocyanin
MRIVANASMLLIASAAAWSCRQPAQIQSDAGARPAAPASPTPQAASASSAPADIASGTQHVIRMLGDSRGYRFEPAELVVRQGESVRFVMVSGGPHNIAFDSVSIPAGSKERLSQNTSSQMGNFMGPMLLSPDEAYIVSFAGLPPGKYPFHCLPHAVMNQRGSITVTAGRD